MSQKISKLFAFNIIKALTKVHVTLLISSTTKAKLGVRFNCQNFLSGDRIRGCRFMRSHPLHSIFCSVGKQRCFSVSNPQRSRSQVKSYHLRYRTSTLQTNVGFQMLPEAYPNHNWCYRDRASGIIWLVLSLLSVMMREVKRAHEEFREVLVWENIFQLKRE